MLFNSLEFIIFLPVVWVIYWFVTRSVRSQNWFLLAASYLFYGWWDWRFLLLIALTSASSYASGILMERDEKHRKAYCTANVTFNLLILATFKYFNFFVDNAQALAQSLGYTLDAPTLNVVLPVGISFYTFQALSYTLDIYRRQLPATRDAVAFFAYISFFPQLVAGPIERATRLLPQIQRRRTFDYATAVDGCRQILWGFAKKLLVADQCAAAVNYLWNDWQSLSGLNLLLLGVLFTMQIYGDFSGYSDIAIGSAKLFGIKLMQNFNLPYFSRSIPEFWRRWHISLTTWFIDYVYIPLGGSRVATWKVIRNIFIVWAISGLWHGANWTFVAWGLFHAALLTIYRLAHIDTKHAGNIAEGRMLPSLKEAGQIALTFLLVTVGLMIFRSVDVSQAFGILWRMVSHPLAGPLLAAKTLTLQALAAAAALLVIEWIQRTKEHPLQFGDKSLLARFEPARIAIYLALLVMMILMVGEVQTFIYFQF